MRRLTNIGVAWRNYLYANLDGEYNDADNFIIRMDLITDSQEEIKKIILKDDLSLDLINNQKEDILFQKAALHDTIEEFAIFSNERVTEVSEVEVAVTEILDGLCEEGNNNYFLEVAKDWKELGDAAHRIWEKLIAEKSEVVTIGTVYRSADTHDRLCRLMMEEVYEKDSI